jgi:TPR repeat protein
MAFTSRQSRPISAVFLGVGIFLASVFASQAEAKCTPYPQVAWWGKLSHEGVNGYVNNKHGGAWPGYLDKWQRQHAFVKFIHAKGLGIKIRSTGQTLKGQPLGVYIANLAQRVEINQCLAQQQNGDGKTITRKKTKLKTTTTTPFGKGVIAYRAGDFKAAHDIWLRLAVGGNLKAQNAIGHLYYKGLGVSADLSKSRLWYASSAAHGDPVGQFSVGNIDRNTATTKEEFAKAVSLIEKAAMKNYAMAQFAMSKIHQKGEYGPIDNHKAYFWAILAMKNNYKKAQPLLKHLEQLLSQADKHTQSARAIVWLTRSNS